MQDDRKLEWNMGDVQSNMQHSPLYIGQVFVITQTLNLCVYSKSFCLYFIWK